MKNYNQKINNELIQQQLKSKRCFQKEQRLKNQIINLQEKNQKNQHLISMKEMENLHLQKELKVIST